MEDSNNVNNTQIFQELIGFSGNDLAGLGVDHRALEVLQGQLMVDMDYLEGENQQILDPNDPKYIALQMKIAERAQVQQKLFEADKLGIHPEESKIQNNAEIENNFGVNQLCKIRTRGHNENVLRLTEIFLPAEDDPIRIAMDQYNKQKMPRLRNMLDPKYAEQRKRNLKVQIKSLNDNLKNRMRKPQLSQNANLQYLLNEKVNQEQITQVQEQRHQNLANIQKSSFQNPLNEKQKSQILGTRIAPSKIAIDENLMNQSKKKQKQTLNELQINQKNEDQQLEVKKSIMNKVMKNLQIIQKYLSCDQKKSDSIFKNNLASKIFNLNKKLENINFEDDENFDIQNESFIQKYLTSEEQQILKYSFNQNFMKKMEQRYPSIPNFILSQTEKECFLFCCENDFEKQNSQSNFNFITEQRQINSKNLFLGTSFNFSKNEEQKIQEESLIKKSLFGKFMKNENEYIVQNKLENNIQYLQNENFDTGKLKCDINHSAQYYEDLEKDGRIRDAMNRQKFLKLSKLNPDSKPFFRRKYWGELKDAVSQKQIDKDFNLFRYFESNLTNEINSKEPLFILKNISNSSSKFQGLQPDFDENADSENQIQFNSKYGSLNLINANANNFKIQNVSEYEFVQRQRAFIYDPLHLKGSSQLKSFSALVGFGCLNYQKALPYHQITLQKEFDKDQTVQNLCQNVESLNDKQINENSSNQISQEMLDVYNILGIQPKIDFDINAKDQQLDPRSLQSYNKPNTNNASKINVDLKKQKQQKLYPDLVNNINDNFDALTDNVKIRKLEDLIQRKQEEENRKNAINEKKYPSTAYRELNLQITKPRIQRKDSQDQEIGSQDKKDDYNQISSSQKHKFSKQENSDNEMHDEDKSEKSQESNFQNENHSHKSQDDIEMKEMDENDIDENISESTNEEKLFYEDVPDANVAQVATHAKCIFDLSFTKFEWSLNEDYTKCHRPDIASLFQFERDKINSQDNFSAQNFPLQNSNTQISIGAFGDPRIINQKPQVTENRNQDEMFEIPLQIIDRETVKSKNKKRGIINADEYFKDRVKLSLKDGKFCLFEHIDQHPIYVNNFGMVSKLERYIYSDKLIPRQEFLPSSNNNKLKHMGPYGQQNLKGASSKLPLLGNLDKSKFQGITILSNKLFRAPVFFHKTQPTDFFCSFHEDKKGQKKIVLREIQSIYTVGQIEPIMSVYDPQSRSYQNFIKQRCQAYILRFLKENNNWLDFQNILSVFSYLTDQKLKKFIKEISVEVNRDQICSSTKQINDETIKNLISPEMICQYESSRYGEAMLTKSGIESITKAGKISYASNRYCQDQKNILRQKISKFIENEVLCTPWNLSQNFCTINSSQSNQGHSGMLMIKGVGDPSNGNGGYSFLKMPLKISNDSLQDCMRIRVDLNPAIQNPKSVTGTDADLRKLKKEVIFNKLVEMGYDVREILSMTRWNMVGLLREQSSSQQRSNQLDEKNKRYARGIRYTSKTQREVYHKRVDELFKSQMMYLTGQRDLNEDSDYEDPISQLNVPGQQNKHSQGKINQIDDDNSQDGEILGFNQMEGIKKFMVEVTDKQQIKELLTEKPFLNDNGEEINIGKEKQSGSIQKLFDIPNYKKLLLAKIEAPNQNIQSGQQIGLLRSGTGQINQTENIQQVKTAEQILEEGLKNKTFELNIEILKKVIRNEDNISEIERMELISADKIVNQFKKRQKKCKSRRSKKRVTNLKQQNKGSGDHQTVDQDYSRSLVISGQNNPDQIKLESSLVNKNQINLSQKQSSQLQLSASNLQQIDLQGPNDILLSKNKNLPQSSIKLKQASNLDQQLSIPLKVGDTNQDLKKSSLKQTKVTTLAQLNKGENIDQVLKNQDKMNMKLNNRSLDKEGEFKMPMSVPQIKDSKSNSRYKGQQSISSSSTINKPSNQSFANVQKDQLLLNQDPNSTIINLNGQFQQLPDNNFQGIDISQLSSNPLFSGLFNINSASQIYDQQILGNNDSIIQINQDYQIQQNAGIKGSEITINLGTQNLDFHNGNNANKQDIFNNQATKKNINISFDNKEDANMKFLDQEIKNKKNHRKQQDAQEKKVHIKKQKQSDDFDEYRSQNQSKQQVTDKTEMLLASLQKEQENSMRTNKKLQSSRRAKQSGESILNSVIEQIIEECIKQDPKMIFRYRVEKKVAPGYYGIIKQPVCLEDMKHKAKRQEYKNVQSFKDDMTLMRANCEQYNGLASEFSQSALFLEQHAFELLQSKDYNDLIQTAALKIDYQN